MRVPAQAIGDSIDVLLQQAADRMQGLPEVQGRAVYGLTGEELALFSKEVDILVVGSRGYGALERLVLGSTSDYLQRHAHCPLLVLRRGAAGAVDVHTVSDELASQVQVGASA